MFSGAKEYVTWYFIDIQPTQLKAPFLIYSQNKTFSLNTATLRLRTAQNLITKLSKKLVP